MFVDFDFRSTETCTTGALNGSRFGLLLEARMKSFNCPDSYQFISDIYMFKYSIGTFGTVVA